MLQKRNLLAIIPYLCYLYLLTLIPDTSHSTVMAPPIAEGNGVHRESALNSTPVATALASPLPQALTRLTFLGVSILGVLSGFGAVRNTSVLCSSLVSRRISEKAVGKRKAGITEEDLTHAEGSLRRVRGDLEDRKAQLASLASIGAPDNKVSAHRPRCPSYS